MLIYWRHDRIDSSWYTLDAIRHSVSRFRPWEPAAGNDFFRTLERKTAAWCCSKFLSKDLLAVSPVLDSTYEIFVRKYTNSLYYGTHSDVGKNGHRQWVLMSYNISKDEWLDQKIDRVDMVGKDIGQSICFEILHGHFYGLLVTWLRAIWLNIFISPPPLSSLFFRKWKVLFLKGIFEIIIMFSTKAHTSSTPLAK